MRVCCNVLWRITQFSGPSGLYSDDLMTSECEEVIAQYDRHACIRAWFMYVSLIWLRGSKCSSALDYWYFDTGGSDQLLTNRQWVLTNIFSEIDISLEHFSSVFIYRLMPDCFEDPSCVRQFFIITLHFSTDRWEKHARKFGSWLKFIRSGPTRSLLKVEKKSSPKADKSELKADENWPEADKSSR